MIGGHDRKNKSYLLLVQTNNKGQTVRVNKGFFLVKAMGTNLTPTLKVQVTVDYDT
jgi:hypothetical protein